ncbi:unnamed protein product [Nesidiocoris tenuis]|uniref:Protein kinase domain-containing protein n=1 Tax=Nesidiocoris tenuis TaxID=355587 RepID=A0A6H5HMD9_9HEMI|nr:unnamed protein product [Nesidiocoris tenuis]
MADIEEEYKILRDLSSHPNLPDFYGAYKKSDDDGEKIWFVMQLCEGGPVTDLVRALNREARKMNELHIAFILREVLKALMALHESHIIHRDVKASNVLLTRDGEVKLVDFGLSRELSSTMGKRQTCLGSPCWMAPEVVTSKNTKGSYDNRADVWALGITAIELGDGKAPFQDMHPTRALFQIVRNPPPTLYRPANWSQDYNDFISECLTKNPEHRPYMSELIQHPFFSELPENDHHNYNKYKFKSRSDNEPHIFGVADSAYQDMLHHNTVQSIVISGETMSGKTTQARHTIRHLTHLGTCRILNLKDVIDYKLRQYFQSSSKVSERVLKAVDLIHAFANAATPENPDSTRHASVTQVTFSSSGKLSGAIFWILQLEKFRVTGNRSPYHANFHIFYYFYDGLKDAADLEKYNLEADKSYGYLRRNILEDDKDAKVPPGPREDAEGNVVMFKRVCTLLEDLGFVEDEVEVVWRTMAAIILLGEIEYKDDDDKNADISNTEVVDKIATLLCVDSKKLAWALCNYCVIEQDTAARRRHSKPEALLARNVFAQNLYSRLVDWIVNNINCKLSLSRAVYGDPHCVNVVDIFGIECYPGNNNLEQLFVNAMNEQIQFFYNQKIFISAMRYNTVSKGEFSQTRGIRTAAATFRSTCLELLRMLSQGSTHFVRCLRTDLTRAADGFQPNIVKQQLRALAVTDTARARKIGFSHRIPFDKFLDSYQFLAFDFDENVEKTKDNCRLLMIRLKMEGWMMGNSKVFLKYYNEEFLSRLYETQVKKIVKVQSMLRSFLARRNVEKKKTLSREHSLQTEHHYHVPVHHHRILNQLQKKKLT